jgi:hypothetical protein
VGDFESGRWERVGTHALTDDHLQIDVRRWQREGVLTPGQDVRWAWTRGGMDVATIHVRAEEDSVRLAYRVRLSPTNWRGVVQTIPLEWTPCRLGGRRPWFLCPEVVEDQPCRRRCAVLYFAEWGFRCLSCADLRYASQREGDLERARNRLAAIRQRLGGPPLAKPAGRHWSTQLALIPWLLEAEWRYDEVLAARCAAVDAWVDRNLKRLGVTEQDVEGAEDGIARDVETVSPGHRDRRSARSLNFDAPSRRGNQGLVDGDTAGGWDAGERLRPSGRAYGRGPAGSEE